MKRSLERYLFIAIVIGAVFFARCRKDKTNPNNLPVANFTFAIANNQSLPPASVNFTSTSQYVTTYKWYFGDGNTSTNQNPVNNYTLATYTGSPYTVKLVVSNSYGKDSITKQVSFASTFITGVSNYALPNSIITITGIGFTAGTANNTVTINGISATVSSATATAVTVTVPANATSGPLVLTTNGTSLTSTLTVYALGVANTGNNTYFKHITYSYSSTPNGSAGGYAYGYSYYGDWETDSVKYVSYYNSGSDAGGFSNYASTYQAVPAGVKLWGIVNGYAVGANDYRVYKFVAAPNYSVFAGSGVSGYADGQGTSAQFVAPQGMAADAAGNLYVNDAHRIRKISTTGMVTTLAGSGADGNADGQGTAATFGNLYGICVDAGGNIYVSDDEFLNIRKISPTGTVTTLAGSGTAGFADGTGRAAQFYFPKGMTADGQGNIFVSDGNYNNTTGPYTSAIRMVNSLGVVTTVLNSNKGDKISNPDGIAYTGTGFLICNTGPGAANQYLSTVSFFAK